MLKHTLLAPTGRPSSLVALFHGLGDGLHTLRPVAKRWQAALPRTAFLLMEAPDRDYFQREMLDGSFSGDWFSESLRPRAAGETAEQAYTATIAARCDGVNAELNRHMRGLGVGNRQLVLSGFSQGAALSAYAGLRRGCLGVLPLGGPCQAPAVREALLPRHNDVTRVCVVVGSRDEYASASELRAAFSRYGGNAAAAAATAAKLTPPATLGTAATDGVHVVEGLRHEVGEESILIGLRFLKSMFGSSRASARASARSSGPRAACRAAARGTT